MGMREVPKLKYQLNSPIQRIASPESVHLHLNGCKSLLKKGDPVNAGELIAKSDETLSYEKRIHSPLTGKIISITENHINITGEWPMRPRSSSPIDPAEFKANQIKEICREAGIVGMGGGMTPTHMKLSSGQAIDTVLVNVCESEPFLTCDHQVMAEYLDEVKVGLKLAMTAVGAENGMIAPKHNNYVSGYEHFLVEETLGRKVPQNCRPTDVGALVLNLQTVRAIYHAVIEQQSLTERVITVDGGAIEKPGNYLVPIGTSIGHILKSCGWKEDVSEQLIIGGPMMGFSTDKTNSITAGTGGVLALTSKRVAKTQNKSCIRCGMCMESCPFGLPAGRMDENPIPAVLNCIECGKCEFNCPAQRPLLEHIQRAKSIFSDKNG